MCARQIQIHFSSCSSVHEIASIGFLPSAHRQLHCTSAKDEERPKAAQRSEGVEGRYISVAKDGTLSVWNNNLSLHKTIVVSWREERQDREGGREGGRPRKDLILRQGGGSNARLEGRELTL